MTDAGQKRLAELCDEYGCVVTYYDLAHRKWWCLGHAPQRLLARWPIAELEFDNPIRCAKCGRDLNQATWACSEVL
jgi:hypothetical protein